MKAYFIQSDARGTSLELREAPTPQVGNGQLLVKGHAASLNRGELLRGPVGTQPGAPKPMGTDGSGEVVGSGERVMGRLPGAMAEFAVMEKKDAIPVPANLSWEEAAAVPQAFAGMIATGEAPEERERLRAMLERPAVAAELQKMGIPPRDAAARVDAMSEAEVRQLAGRLDAAPAGGALTNQDLLLIIIIVLLIIILL